MMQDGHRRRHVLRSRGGHSVIIHTQEVEISTGQGVPKGGAEWGSSGKLG